jgi:ribose/xylose/arabinose/galactoside ABC-type transport system permease subunit
MGFVAVTSGLAITHHGGLVPGVLAALACGAAIGLVNGTLIAGLGLSPFIVTLGMLTFLRGFGNQLSHGAPIFGFPSTVQYLGHSNWGPIPAPLAIGALVLALMWLVLARSRVGVYIYAIGGSREAARASGIPSVRYEVAAYTLCGALAGVAGVMELSRVSIGYVTNGQGYDLLSIAAAVIGGTLIGGGAGSLSGVVLGVAALTVLSTGLNIGGLDEFDQSMVTGAVVVIAVLVSQSRTGLLTRRVRGLWSRQRAHDVGMGEAAEAARQRKGQA